MACKRPSEIFTSLFRKTFTRCCEWRQNAARGRRQRLCVKYLEEWQKRVRAEALHAEIANYASKHAGTTADLDPILEAAGVEAMLHEAKSKSTRKGKSR